MATKHTVTRGSRWYCRRSLGFPDAAVWTVRDVHVGPDLRTYVYVTSPGSRSPGHSILVEEFTRDHVPTSEGVQLNLDLV